jgi:uncharacterized membrane protein YkoI
MRKRIYLLLAISAIVFGALSPPSTAAAEPAVVRLSELPPAAQKAIHQQLGNGKLGEIAKSIEKGEIVYEVEMTKQRKTRHFTVDEQGELLAEEVFIGELPRPVQKAIRGHVGKGVLGDISKITEDGVINYEVEMTKEGKSRSFTLGEDGKLTEMQLFLGETPAVVQQAIQKELRGGKCGEIHKAIEGGEVSYDVEVITNGKTRLLTFDSGGGLVYQADPVQVSDMPEAAQQTLNRQLQNAKLSRIEKTIEEGEVTFEVQLIKAGKRQSLSIRPDGQIVQPDPD